MSELVSRDAEHLRLLSIFHYVSAGLALAGLAFLGLHFAIFQAVLSNPELMKSSRGGPPPGEFWAIFRWFYLVMALWFLLSGLGNLLSGIYLKRHTHRSFSMVVAGFNCLWMPLGTVLGVFTFIVLGRQSVVELYAAPTSPAPSTAAQ